MNREDKLKKLKDDKAAKSFVVASVGEPFIEAIQSKIGELKETLGLGVELNNLDELLVELEQIEALRDSIDDLKKEIKDIYIPDMPDSVKIKGLDSLIKATEKVSKLQVKTEQIDIKPFIKKMDSLISKIDSIKVPPQGQRPTDFVPMRRVVYVSGKTPMFDDSFYTGGGGGGSNNFVDQNNNPTTVKLNSSGQVPVDATLDASDIEIGAVEIKDGSSDNRQTVDSSGAASQNITKIGSTTIDTNSGNKSAGTQRVVIATDQPNLTTPLNINTAQINGVATTMGNGASGTGVQRVTVASDSTGNLATIGTSVTPGTSAAHLGKAEDAQHGSGDTGVMSLGVRNNTASALATTDGDYIPITTGTNGEVWVGLATLIAGEDQTNGVMKTEQRFSYAQQTADTLVKSGAGFLHTVTFSDADAAPTAGTIDIYDNTAASGTKIFTWTLTTTAFNPTTITLDVNFATGLYIDFTTTADVSVTVSYR